MVFLIVPEDTVMSDQAPLGSLRALRLPDIIRLTGLSRSQIYRMEAAGQFPKRISLTSRTTAWLHHEVEAWIAHRVQLSRGNVS